MSENDTPRNFVISHIKGVIQKPGEFGSCYILTEEALKKAVEFEPEVPVLLNYDPNRLVGNIKLSWDEKEKAIVGKGSILVDEEATDTFTKDFGLPLQIEIHKRKLGADDKTVITKFVANGVGMCERKGMIGKLYNIEIDKENIE